MSEWTKWKGGECPVEPETVVEVLLRCELYERSFVSDPGCAGRHDWQHDPEHEDGDVVAWTTDCPATITNEQFQTIADAINRQEVQGMGTPTPPEKPFSTRITEAEEKADEALADLMGALDGLARAWQEKDVLPEPPVVSAIWAASASLDDAREKVATAAALARDYARKEG